MALNFNNIQIDEELENLLPPLSKEDYQMLEHSLLQHGFMQHSTRIQLWCPPEEEENDNDAHPAKSYIIDGHNRYRICQKHNIDLPSWCFDWLCFDTKEDVKKYIYENQLARRNLTPIQKISTCAVRFYSHTTKLGTQIQWICSFLGHYKRNLSLSEPDILIVIPR